eukprot:NODE_457_length_2073_cov_29.924407_g363_i0.p1 GENE.NODE_457_length_2073_cov_29.924407_g363_i0~~NODE_457_length_2073_cov_29.924407_g363_i0.p1  ORF type:complete len:443 (-),score=152.39 NODE_457_length_2073_cov_29.924407_g363_i0:745-1953(-)
MEELTSFWTNRSGQLRAVFTAMDEDEKGHLTSFELREAALKIGHPLSDSDVRKILHRMDTRHDGRITFRNFKNYFMLAPGANPTAVFDSWYHRTVVDDAAQEYTTPRDIRSETGPHGTTQVIGRLASGCVAGCASRTLTAPIDRLKMLMQMGSAPEGQKGIVGGLRAIYKEGGFRAFFRGNGTNCLKVAPETSIKFLFFDLLKSRFSSDHGNPTVLERFVAGGLAGAGAQAVIYPLEVAKTRMCLSSPGAYRSIGDCLVKVVKTNGVKGLYAGLLSSVGGIVPYAAIDLTVLSLLKDAAARIYADRASDPGVPVMLACGMMSSTAAMLATYPLNLVRTRLQAVGMPGARDYTGIRDVFVKTYRAEGYFGFYRGLFPNMLKVLPATGVSYAIYEFLNDRFVGS